MKRRKIVSRQVIIFFAVLSSLILVSSVRTYATLITFDELTPGSAIGSSYPGVTFFAGGTYASDNHAYAWEDPGNEQNMVMGAKRFGGQSPFFSDSLIFGWAEFSDPVDFVSMQGVVGYPGYGGNFQAKYWSNIHPQGTSFFIASDSSLFLEISQQNGWLQSNEFIDKIEIRAWSGNYYTYIDSFTFNSGSASGTAAVPEPATIVLFGSGLMGLVGFRKKFQKEGHILDI